MTSVHVKGSEWPVRCAGQPGGVRVWESLETDPQPPPWRLVTDRCFRPRRERERHGVRRVAPGEVLDACPELAGAVVVTGEIARPNGKPYRPRKVTGHAVAGEDDLVVAVLVLGTHDTERARPLAENCVRAWVDGGYTAASPVTGWWRDGFEMGQRCWVDDPVRGRAGVWFEAVEAS